VERERNRKWNSVSIFSICCLYNIKTKLYINSLSVTLTSYFQHGSERRLFLRCTIFSQMFWRIKTNFYHPTTIPVLQFYVKELLWNEKSREHRRAKSNRVWLSKKKSLWAYTRRLRRTNGGVTLWLPAGHEDAAEWPDQEIGGILSTPGGGEIRLWWDEYGSCRRRRVQGTWSGWPWSEVHWNTPGGAGKNSHCKSSAWEATRSQGGKRGERNLSIAMKSDFGHVGCARSAVTEHVMVQDSVLRQDSNTVYRDGVWAISPDANIDLQVDEKNPHVPERDSTDVSAGHDTFVAHDGAENEIPAKLICIPCSAITYIN
jgi:hypothetical protein